MQYFSKECFMFYLHNSLTPTGTNLDQCGFRGCPMLGHSYDTEKARHQQIPFDSSNIAMTYTSLASLLILGDDLSRVHKKAVIQGVKSLQQADGSFVSVLEGSEYDMRFVYCACCICHMLNDWSGVDMDKAASYIVQSLSYEGAFGQRPFNEAHGIFIDIRYSKQGVLGASGTG
ncbi:geranylgeranyl transferase type-1 subunit beta [Elysia marginata]|uniref:Geranylgeranyl transferase type-1 subunit beta n=1 Tax=Elysia marginata TaxID=1093978 RepID=A0AAV4HKX1_9GAST|nr:geranylgeranyl transferase type-1 subunit beta [Elysia marginata]